MNISTEYSSASCASRRSRFSALLCAAILSLLAFALQATSANAACTGNAIACENQLTGSSGWQITGSGDSSIQGFSTDISVNVGGTIYFKVNTSASSYTLNIYRMGYYQGNGARLISTIKPSVTLPQKQPNCLTDSSTKLYDCGNWAVSASWAVPSTAVSGIYFARLVRADTGGASHIFFVVRNDASHSDLLFQASDETWQAYNPYGGNSLYGTTTAWDLSNRAYKVSYNRPSSSAAFQSLNWVTSEEYPMIRWLEANGYDVTYFTGVDAARNGSLIQNHKTYLSVGHDEYWSGPQRTNVEAARDAGINLAFFSGNEVFWKVRWENSIDGTNTAYRTMVCYKETLSEKKIDPTSTWTGTWRDPSFSPPSDGGRPENSLTGTIFKVNGPGTDNNNNLSIQVPAADGKMRFWRNTTIATQSAGATAVLPSGTLGYEWDIDWDNGFRPAGAIPLSTATYNLTVDYLEDYGGVYGGGTATHRMIMYRAPSGALVFGAGSVQWDWGLDSTHDNGGSAADVRMKQATVNLFADMGVQPTTLQSGLVAATKSTDTMPPTSAFTSPASGATVQFGIPITVTGTATDTGGGVIGGVEISADGGNTWHAATGRESWSFSWAPLSQGAVTLMSRAVDDSGNLQSPATVLNLNVPTSGAPSDASVKTDLASPSSSIASPSFSTKSGSELLLAFIGADYNNVGANTTVTSITGGGLTWVLAVRSNGRSGTSEIWRAFAPSPLNNVAVTANLSNTVLATMTVMSFTGLDPSGTNGSGAIGATATKSAATGAPTASLVTTRAGSWVMGVGNDYDNAIARTPGSGQALLHQYLTANGDTYWVQTQNAATANSGTTVTINDTAPTGDQYNLAIVELLAGSNGAAISGTVTPTSLGTGVLMTLSGTASNTATTDSSGNYSFTGLANGSYTVTPSKTGVTFSPASIPITITTSGTTAANFTVPTWSITGNVSGASSVTVTLSGTAAASATTDASGNYTFSGLLTGSYTVTPSKSGFTFSPVNQAFAITSGSASTVTASGFTATPVPTYSISGNVAGATTVTVTLSGTAAGSTTTDGSGNYSFTGLANGSYTVTPSKSGFTFTPINQPAPVSNANVTLSGFTATPVPTFSITGSVTGASTVTVTLSGAAAATTTTDVSGNYSFIGLLPGSYTVTPSKSGFTFNPVSQPAPITNASVALGNFAATAAASKWTLVQSVGTSATAPATTNTLPITASGTGNLIVIAVQTGNTITVSSITDNATGGSNTYVQATGARAVNTSTRDGVDIWYAKNSKSGATTITVNLSSGIPGSITAWEVSGISTTAPFDVAAAANTQAASASPQGPALTTTVAGDFVVSAIVVANDVTGIFSGNEFTNDTLSNGNGFAHITSTSATAGSHRAQWVQSPSGAYCGTAAAFKVGP